MPRRSSGSGSDAGGGGGGDEDKDPMAPLLIRVFKNGDERDVGTKVCFHFNRDRDVIDLGVRVRSDMVLVNPRNHKDFDSFLDLVTKRSGVLKPVMKIYTTEGSKIKAIDALEENGQYVVVDGKGKFVKADYGGEKSKIGWDTKTQVIWNNLEDEADDKEKKKKKK